MSFTMFLGTHVRSSDFKTDYMETCRYHFWHIWISYLPLFGPTMYISYKIWQPNWKYTRIGKHKTNVVKYTPYQRLTPPSSPEKPPHTCRFCMWPSPPPRRTKTSSTDRCISLGVAYNQKVYLLMEKILCCFAYLKEKWECIFSEFLNESFL
jgi:hypothetical protein